LRPNRPLFALRTLCALSASLTLRTLLALSASLTLRTLCALSASLTLRTLLALSAGLTLRALEAHRTRSTSFTGRALRSFGRDVIGEPVQERRHLTTGDEVLR